MHNNSTHTKCSKIILIIQYLDDNPKLYSVVVIMIAINWNLPGGSADSGESREVEMNQRQEIVVEGRVTIYSL